ncbi:MAG: hypothetical protein QME40_06290 [bacterium]|nr:hypothetical protein [bacterium]
MKEIHNILLLRTASKDVCEKALEFLKVMFPEAKITIISPNKIELEGIYKVIVYDWGDKISIFRVKRLNQILRDKEFDLTLCLWENRKGLGYLNVDLLLFYIGKDRYAFTKEGDFIELTKRRFLKKLFHELSLLPLKFLLIITLTLILGITYVYCLLERILLDIRKI